MLLYLKNLYSEFLGPIPNVFIHNVGISKHIKCRKDTGELLVLKSQSWVAEIRLHLRCVLVVGFNVFDFVGVSPTGDEGENEAQGQKRGGGEEEVSVDRKSERRLYDNGWEKLDTCPRLNQEPLTMPQSVESPGEVSTMLFLLRDNYHCG